MARWSAVREKESSENKFTASFAIPFRRPFQNLYRISPLNIIMIDKTLCMSHLIDSSLVKMIAIASIERELRLLDFCGRKSMFFC